MTVDRETLSELRETYPASSWAIWRDSFPEEGCLEADPNELVAFIEDNREQLNPSVVFCSLNPSGAAPESYRNFHSTDAQHSDGRLKRFIQDGRLETLSGGYMTDLVPKEVTADSSTITPSDADVERFLDEVTLLDQEAYTIVCFTGKAFEAMTEFFETGTNQEEHNVESFVAVHEGRVFWVTRVWFYGLYGRDAEKIEELERQLALIDQRAGQLAVETATVGPDGETTVPPAVLEAADLDDERLRWVATATDVLDVSRCEDGEGAN